jgi:arsenate reductase
VAKVFNVLFLCTHNSARSILAEAILSRLGEGQFRGFSAGSYPKSKPNQLALELLERLGHPIDALRSKSWDEFDAPDAPHMDFIITVCDQAAGEVCPVWPGQPVTAHWGMPDPSSVAGTDDDRRKAFWQTYVALQYRLRAFTSLRAEALDRLALERQMREIGTMRVPS